MSLLFFVPPPPPVPPVCPPPPGTLEPPPERALDDLNAKCIANKYVLSRPSVWMYVSPSPSPSLSLFDSSIVVGSYGSPGVPPSPVMVESRRQPCSSSCSFLFLLPSMSLAKEPRTGQPLRRHLPRTACWKTELGSGPVPVPVPVPPDNVTPACACPDPDPDGNPGVTTALPPPPSLHRNGKFSFVK